MGKKSRRKGGLLLPLLALAGAAVAANALSEKANALRRVAENWEVTGFKIREFDGLNARLQVELTFYNTSRQAAVLDALTMTVKYKGGVIGIARLPQRTTIGAQGVTKVQADVTVAVSTLLLKAVSATDLVRFVASLKGKSVNEMLTMLQQKAGLKGVTFEGDIVVAGLQRHFSFTTDLGNVTVPVKPTLGPATDAPTGAASTTA